MTAQEPPREAVSILPVWKTVGDAYRIVFGKLPTLARVLVLPVIASFALSMLGNYIDLPYPGIVWVFILALPWTLLSIPWLRLILLPKDRARTGSFDGTARRYLRFLAYSLLLTCIDLPQMLFSHTAGSAVAEEPVLWIASWALILLAVYIEMRFAFVYVATAVDENYDLVHAWRHSHGPAWRLFAVIVIAVIAPWQAFNYLLGSALTQVEPMTGVIVIGIVWHIFLWATNAVYLTVIALAFRTCTGWVPAPDHSILERFE